MMHESLERSWHCFAHAHGADRPPLRLVHLAGRAVAHSPLHLALSGNLDGSNDFAVGPDWPGAGHVAAFAVDVGARRYAAVETTWDIVREQAAKAGRDEPNRATGAC